MTDRHDLVAVIDVAERLGVYKQTVFKAIRRLGIVPMKKRDGGRGNQVASFITRQQERQLAEEIRTDDSRSDSNGGSLTNPDDFGFFYIIQLEPEHDPGRLKLGFSISVSERLRKHRCSAPFASVLKTWPCRRTWERAALDCVGANNERLHTEIFRFESVDVAIARAEGFFALMPSIIDDTADEDRGE